jgi:hypothetical protein
LEPDKVFANTIDSLRDFIIALDKEKADHLRYKVDGDVVKIFITPYRTVITDKDLEFSQGDYNVELVLALGVENQEHLDMALAAHGQILHDVAVATLSAGNQVSRLGSIDWCESGASCLSEMVTTLSDSLKTDAPILDKQIATALLTGIVAATDRFSNAKTNSASMSMAAQLMAAGADQQLIASKLQESHQINSISKVTNEYDQPAVSVGDGESSTLPQDNLVISHDEMSSADAPSSVSAVQTNEPNNTVSTLPPSEEPKIILDSKSNVLPDMPSPYSETSTLPVSGAPLGNVNNSLVSEYLPKSQTEILDHSNTLPVPDKAEAQAITSSQPSEPKLMDILDNDNEPSPSNTLPPAISTQIKPSVSDSLRDADEARAAAESVIGSQNNPGPAKTVDLPLPPPLPDFSAMTIPNVPEFNTVVSSEQKSPAVDDPAQFRIPGQ